MVISKNGGKRKKKDVAPLIGGGGGSGNSGGVSSIATTLATSAAAAAAATSSSDSNNKAELPKRIKIHAQRKFAQGQGHPSSSTSSSPSSTSLLFANQSSQQTQQQQQQQPQHMKDCQPTELLPNLRPNTEDFLTFLCLRGTPVLPPHLNYLNPNRRQTSTTSTTSTAASATTTTTAAAATLTAILAPIVTTTPDPHQICSSALLDQTTISMFSALSTTTTTTMPAISSLQMLPPPAPPPPPPPLSIPLSLPVAAQLSATETLQFHSIGSTPIPIIDVAPVKEISSDIHGNKTKSDDTNGNEQTEEKSPFIPFAVRKHAEIGIEGKRRQAVQALKKKYQEQRMAKTKLKNIVAAKSNACSAAATVSNTNCISSSVDIIPIAATTITIAAAPTITTTTVAPPTPPPPPPPQTTTTTSIPVQTRQTRLSRKDVVGNIETDSTTAAITEMSKISSTISKEMSIETCTINKDSIPKENKITESTQRVSLRNSHLRPQQQQQDGGTKRATKQRTQSSRLAATTTTTTPISIETDDERPPIVVESLPRTTRRGTRSTQIIAETTMAPNGKTGPMRKDGIESNSKEKSSTSTRVTRQKSSASQNDLNRSEVESKSLIKMELSKSAKSKKSKIVDERIDDDDGNGGGDNDEEEAEEFSSDDDIPLVKKIKKSPPKSNRKRSAKKSTLKLDKTMEEKSEKPTEDVDSIKSETHRNKEGTPTAAPCPTTATGSKETKKSTPKTNQRKRKSPPIGADQSHTDQSETETRTNARPMRKTKTAAAIYMELIGQKLNLGDFDDDNASMDSFPELPNVRKTEQMENELKAMVGKDKTSVSGKAAIAKTKIKGKTTVATLTTDSERDEMSPEPQKLPSSPAAAATTAAANRKKIKQKKISTSDQICSIANVITEQHHEDKLFSETETLTSELPSKRTRYAKKDEVDTAESLVLLAQSGGPNQLPEKRLEKSFSDSDDEPLAIKVTKKPPSFSKFQTKQSIDLDAASFEIIDSDAIIHTDVGAPAVTTNSSEHVQIIQPKLTVDLMKIRPETLNLFITTNKNVSQHHPLGGITEKIESPPATLFSTLKNTVENTQQLLSMPSMDISLGVDRGNTTKTSPIKGGVGIGAAITTVNVDGSSNNQTQAISSILANLMPSKEESGKIFGIASVSLAQSSGPNDTKCTLGKCGSIHKPPLGPVVPTESLLLTDQMSTRERRKAKVNMTHEQIQKWLTDCSEMAPRYPEQEILLDEDYDFNILPNPIDYMMAPSPFRELYDKDTGTGTSAAATASFADKTAAKSIRRIPSLRHDKLSSIPKGPSLKATPIAAVKDDPGSSEANELVAFDAFDDSQSTGDDKSKIIIDTATTTPPRPPPTRLNQNTQSLHIHKQIPEKTTTTTTTSTAEPILIEQILPKTRAKDTKATAVTTAVVVPKKTTAKRVTQKSPTKSGAEKQSPKSIATNSSAQQSGKAISSPSATAKTTSLPMPDKKPIYNQRRTPVYNTKMSEPQLKQAKPIVNSFGAFSPDNEASVYSFDKEEDTLPTPSTPFRRHSRRGSSSTSRLDDVTICSRKDDSATTSRGAEKTTTTNTMNTTATTAELTPPKKSTATTTTTTTRQQAAVSLTLSPEDNSKSASIAVQVSMDVTSTAATSVTIPSRQRMNVPRGSCSSTTAAAAASGGISSATAAATTISSPTTGRDGIGAGGNDGNDSDSEGHTFYIPLQGTNITGGKSDQLIQGVAVKLGTEGPDGPNQRVIMHAKLVTKAQMGTNATPIPEGMANVHELVKSLIANKESSGSRSVPVGTVQPRFKSSGAVATTSAAAAASAGVSQQQQQPTFQLQPIQSSGCTSDHNRQMANTTTKRNSTKFDCSIKPSNNAVFPRHDDPAQMVEALTFRPTDKEFQDPIEFIERITPIAARFGLCRIIPPATFKPECNISDDMRFRAYNLYVHKMFHRWGPSAKEFSAIKKYLATQRITLTHPPWIGGMEVDLPRLYHTVQELGGLKEVIEKKKWPRVAEEMCIPKSAQDRVTKLDDIYCKYLLPYDTLSPAERQKLFDEVEADWAKTEAKARRNADRCVSANDDDDEESEDVENADGNANDDDDDDDDEDDDDDMDGSMECIVKGRNMPLSAFFRIARNTMALWFKNTEPTSTEVEAEFWRHVAVRDSHVCVHSGSIDSSGRGYGFPTPNSKAKAGAKHPWNLKVLTNNQESILRSIGPVTGVTVPTLHVGMLFSAVCWYRDPHGLPWIEYLHTGGSKIWYGVPDEQSANFRSAFTSLVPTHCQNKTVWLPCDTAMVPPHMLTDRGVSLCRTEQEPGQFVVVFPRAYTSSLCTGYSISESVYFGTNSWLTTADVDFKDIHDSCEPAMFSLEQLLFAVASDIRTNTETLTIVMPMMTQVYDREVAQRKEIKSLGVTKTDKEPVKGSKNASADDYECDTCRANLYISWIKTDDDGIYCLQHAIMYLTNKRIDANVCKLIITYTIEDIAFLISKIKEKINPSTTSATAAASSSASALLALSSTIGGSGAGGGGMISNSQQSPIQQIASSTTKTTTTTAASLSGKKTTGKKQSGVAISSAK